MNRLQGLDSQVREERGVGQSLVLKLTHELAPDDAVAGLLRGDLGHHPPLDPAVSRAEPSNLLPISTVQSRDVVEALLSRDLAYDGPLVSTERAADLAHQIVAALPSGSWFTNGDYALLRASGSDWYPLTAATFDAGVIGVTSGEILVAWFADED